MTAIGLQRRKSLRRGERTPAPSTASRAAILRVIYWQHRWIFTAHIPNDAISATAKALGVLVAFTARREGVSHDELLRFSQDAIGEFARDAQTRLD